MHLLKHSPARGLVAAVNFKYLNKRKRTMTKFIHSDFVLQEFPPSVSFRIDADELLTHLHLRRNKKSTGQDGILTEALKQMPMECIDMLAKMFNECLKRAYWPACFKVAMVVPIPKGQRTSDRLAFYSCYQNYLKNVHWQELRVICV